MICKTATNRQQFPIDDARLFNRNEPWRAQNGKTQWINKLLRRCGAGEVIAGKWVKRWSPEIIHSHFGTRGWEDLDLKRKACARLVTSFYGVDAWSLPKSDQIWQGRYKELFLAGDLFLVEGPAMEQRLIGLSCPPEKIRVLRIGVDLANLAFQSRNFDGELKVAMLGRFVEKKGLPDGLRACAAACRGSAKLTVTIIGDAPGDDQGGQMIKRELLQMAGQPELAGRVDFKGFVPLRRAYELLREQDVFLCPSKHSSDGDAEGGSPVVLTEAMAMGLLCIGTRHCDIPEVIVDGATGFLCDEGDVKGLAAILESLGQNRAKMVQMTIAGRKHIENQFNLTSQMKALAETYRSLLRTPISDKENT